MKWFLFLAGLMFTLSVYSQPSTEQFKEAIEKIERKQHLMDGETIDSVYVEILSYSVIPLRDWWKQLMDLHIEFETQMSKLLMAAEQEAGRDAIDSTKKKDMPKAPEDTTAGKASDPGEIDYVEYFRKKYEETPPSVKVYEVHYTYGVQTNMRSYGMDHVRKVLNMDDLSEPGK